MVAGLPGVSGLTAWQQFIKNPEQQLTQFRNQPSVKSQIEEFREKFRSFSSVEELVDDYGSMQVVLSAFQLEEEINFTARNQKIIEEPYEGEGSEDSIVNQLIDPRYRELAEAFDFQGRGNTVFTSGVVLNEIIDRFVVNEFEKSLGESNPGLREAAFFARSVGEFENTFQLLSNQALRSVIEGGLQLPSQFAGIDIDQQARTLEQRIDVDKFFGEDDEGTTEAFQLSSAQDNVGRLSPLLQTGSNALNVLNSVIDQIQSIEGQLTQIEQDTDPLGPNAAEVAFQTDALGELITADALLGAAEQATNQINQNINQLRSLYQQTVGLDPVADAAQITENQEAYNALVEDIVLQLNTADIVNPETGVTENLLLPVPGPGVTTVNYQPSSTAPAETITGYDLSGFLADVQAANADFQAGNFVGADTQILATRGQFYAARNDLPNQRDAFENNLENNLPQFLGEVDIDAVSQARLAAQQSATNASSIVGLVGTLEQLAIQLSDAGLSAADRADLEQQFSDTQALLDDILNPPDPDNYVTNGGATITVNGFSDINIRGIDFNDPVLYADLDPGVVPLNAADAATLATTLGGIVDDAAELQARLNTDRFALEFIETQANPIASLTDELQSLVDGLPAALAGAAGPIGAEEDEDGNSSGGINLLSPGGSDARVFLNTGISFEIEALNSYVEDVENLIISANGQLLSNSVGATAELSTALTNAIALRDQLRLDLNPVQAQSDQYQTIIDTLAPPEPPPATSEFANPYSAANQFTLDFVQRYISLNDLANQQAAGANDPILQLLQGARDGQVSDSGGASGINLLI